MEMVWGPSTRRLRAACGMLPFTATLASPPGAVVPTAEAGQPEPAIGVVGGGVVHRGAAAPPSMRYSAPSTTQPASEASAVARITASAVPSWLLAGPLGAVGDRGKPLVWSGCRVIA